jgi:hypothetical protein
LASSGFAVIAVALDHAPEDVRPYAEGITFPVLIDPEHVLTELYAISNVPTVVWLDEDDRIVRPNGLAFGTDTFVEFTGVSAGPHLDAVRRWVRDGALPDAGAPVVEGGIGEGNSEVEDLSVDEVLARLHFRIGDLALRRGDEAAAARHLAEASALAPNDFTVRRAALPLTGRDPFGQVFFDIYEEWEAAGRPYHGLPALAPEG